MMMQRAERKMEKVVRVRRKQAEGSGEIALNYGGWGGIHSLQEIAICRLPVPDIGRRYDSKKGIISNYAS